MAEVVPFGGLTRLDLPPDQILEAAIGKMSDVVVIGFDTDGDFYFASSQADGADLLWLLELAKRKLFKVAEENMRTE